MFGALSKTEVGIITLLGGILIGMLVSVFMSYNIKKPQLDKIISDSCIKSEIDTFDISFFGKKVKVTCTNGEVLHYSLLLKGDGSH
jgi:hypothetical protein